MPVDLTFVYRRQTFLKVIPKISTESYYGELCSHLESFTGSQCLDPAIDATGHSVQHSARLGHELHAHRLHELYTIDGGTILMTIENEEYEVHPGQVIFIHPRQAHGSPAASLQPCRLAWIQFRLEALADRQLAEELDGIQLPVWTGNHEIYRRIRAIHAELRSPTGDSRRVVSAQLALLLTDSLRTYRHQHESDRVRPGILFRLCRFIEENSHRPVHMEELVERAGLTRSRIHGLFREYLSQAPHDYIAEKRMSRAREQLLRSDSSITNIAFDLGFSSSQHFSTAFRRRYGITPTAYRANSRQSKAKVGQ